MSRVIANAYRHTAASADAITLDSSGNVTFPANATCSGTATGFGLFSSYAVICDQKSDDTAGGTFTSGSWQTRDLNTEIFDADGIVSISSNQFTLAAGTYLVNASAPAHRVNFHKIRLQNITNSTTLVLGTSEWSHNSYATTTRSFLSARFTISGTTVFELQHRCSTTYATIGFGRVYGYGEEKFAIVEIYKQV